MEKIMSLLSKERFFTDKLYSARWFKSYFLIILGSMIMASGYSFFADPHKIVPGGVYGTAIVIHHVFGFPTGTVGLIFNIPLFALGIYILGPRFGVKTFVGTIATSFFIDFQSKLIENFGWFRPKDLAEGTEFIPSPVQDPFLASLVAGVLIGVGLALIFRAKASTGGSDIIAQIINKYTKISVGQLLIFIDSAIVSVGVIAFKDFSLALYAIITIYLTGKVLDAVMLGGSNRKAVFVVSSKHDEISDFILHKLRRGGTFFFAQGMYGHDDKKVIYTALSRRELSALQDFVRDTDKDAFLSVFDTNQIYGRGFLPLSEEK